MSIYDNIDGMYLINPQKQKNNKSFIFVDQQDEESIPHLHVYHDKSAVKSRCSYVRLDKAEYLLHKGNNIPLPNKIKNEMIELFNTTWDRYIVYENIFNKKGVQATGYEAAVSIWIDANEINELNGWAKFCLNKTNRKPVMPNYNNL